MQTTGYQTAKAAPVVSPCAAPQMATYGPQPGAYAVPAAGACAAPATGGIPPMMAGISPQAIAMAAGIPLNELRSFIMQSLPVAAIAHSYHVDALANPNLRSNAAFQRFSEVELNELHHQVALLGALLRLEMGDASAIADIGLNLTAFLQNRQIAGQLAARLPAAIRQDPLVATVLNLVNQSNQQITQSWPTITRTLSVTAAVAPTATTAPMTNVQ